MMHLLLATNIGHCVLSVTNTVVTRKEDHIFVDYLLKDPDSAMAVVSHVKSFKAVFKKKLQKPQKCLFVL